MSRWDVEPRDAVRSCVARGEMPASEGEIAISDFGVKGPSASLMPPLFRPTSDPCVAQRAAVARAALWAEPAAPPPRASRCASKPLDLLLPWALGLPLGLPGMRAHKIYNMTPEGVFQNYLLQRIPADPPLLMLDVGAEHHLFRGHERAAGQAAAGQPARLDRPHLMCWPAEFTSERSEKARARRRRRGGGTVGRGRRGRARPRARPSRFFRK